MTNAQANEDIGSPEIVQELLDTNSEWTNIQDIIKLTFKGIYQTLKVQNECIRDIEQILPVKANGQEIMMEVRGLMNQKANLNDMKKTMAEVAQNLESKASHSDLKRLVDVNKQEMHHMLQQRITFEDMKSYTDNIDTSGVQ